MLTSINIHSTKKLNRIMNLLKKNNYKACYDTVYDDVCKIHYIIWYNPKGHTFKPESFNMEVK